MFKIQVCKRLIMIFSIFVFVMSFIMIAPSEAAETLKIRMAGQSPLEHQATIHQMKFAKEIEEATDGRIQIKVYPANQLGDYIQVYEEVIKGSIEMALISVPSQFDQRLEITYFPYMVENYDQVKKIYASGGFLFDILDGLHDKIGVKLLGFSIEGFGGFGTTKPIESPADPTVRKKVLIRVPSMDVFRLATEAMGFPTVSIPYAEVYTALQTGVAEGWTGGPPVLTWFNYRDVIKYFYQYNCFVESESWLINKDLWNKLSPADQELFIATAQKMQLSSISISEREDIEYLEKLSDYGMEITTFSDEELAKIADRVREVAWPKLEKRVGSELMEKIKVEFNK